jgi:hypothetical protein
MIHPLTLFYGGLAILALLATWRDDDLRWIGGWLVTGCAISNALFYVHVPPISRTGPYTFLEMMVAVAAACSLTRHPRWPIAILVCNLLSIAANIGLVVNNPPTRGQVYLWGLTTNLLFASECLLVIGAGGGYGRIADFLRGGFHLRRSASQPRIVGKDAGQ